MPDMPPPGDPRVYFAAERTLLAWVRTGIAIMGLGFVVARFGLFLREISQIKMGEAVQSSGISQWLGSSLMLMGVSIILCAAVNHARTLRMLDRNETLRFGRWSLGIVVATMLVLVGTFASIYLSFGSQH